MRKRKYDSLNAHSAPGACLKLYRYTCPEGHTWGSTGDAKYCPVCDGSRLTRTAMSQEQLEALLRTDPRIIAGARQGQARRAAKKESAHA
jgi:hypothetical protein